MSSEEAAVAFPLSSGELPGCRSGEPGSSSAVAQKLLDRLILSRRVGEGLELSLVNFDLGLQDVISGDSVLFNPDLEP